MADNVTLPGTSRVIRCKDRSGVETQLMGLDLNPNGATEVLMAAAALADGAANPTTFLSGACLLGWNGTTWDRLPLTVRANTSVKALNVSIGPTDPISDIPVFMLFDHHQIHEGESWRASYTTTSAAGTNTAYFLITVPNISLTGSTAVVRCPHLRTQIISEAKLYAEIIEAPTGVSAGTSITPINFERNGSYTSLLGIAHTPTGTPSGGTVIWRGLLLASKTSAGSVDTTDDEFVTKNNTAYVLALTTYAATQFLVRWVWYEDKGV